MKVLLVNTLDHGGAANACIRLHLGLLASGVDSTLLVLEQRYAPLPQSILFDKDSYKRDPLPSSIWSRVFASSRKKKFDAAQKSIRLIRQAIPGKVEWFSFSETVFDITKHPAFEEADIINLHWASDFLDYNLFRKTNKPVFWTLHDMNPFTGGCHYAGDCDAYRTGCKICPQLKGIVVQDFTDSQFNYKRECLAQFPNLEIITLSRWMKSCSESSMLFKGRIHHLIPNGIDSKIFTLKDKVRSREKLNLPVNKRIVLFGSYASVGSKRKGFEILRQAMTDIAAGNIVLCAVGNKRKNQNDSGSYIDFGFVDDENTMADLYNAADVFVLPSLEDNLPNTALEAILCGTPVIAFDTGGLKDIIKPGLNGVLSQQITAESLRESLVDFLSTEQQFDRLAIREDAVKRYAVEVQAAAYSELFNNAVGR